MEALLEALEHAARSRRWLWLGAAGAVLLVGASVGTTIVLVRDDVSASAGAIAVSQLRAEWTTAHQIRWAWQAEGDPDQLLHYELVTGPTREAVLARGPGRSAGRRTRTLSSGVFLLPKTHGVEPRAAPRPTVTIRARRSTIGST